MEKDHYDDGNLVDLHPGVEDPSAAYHADYQHETATPVRNIPILFSFIYAILQVLLA